MRPHGMSPLRARHANVPASTLPPGTSHMKKLCLVLLLAASSAPALAQAPAYPTRPITMVVPYPAGGTADLLCRFAADRAGALLGQQMIVENRPGGAGGRVAVEGVLRATPDGYTLLCATQLNYSITHLVFKKSAFDPRGLVPISVLARYPLIVITRAGLPVDNLKDFVALDRSNGGKIT